MKRQRYYYCGYANDIKYVISKSIICSQQNKNFAKKVKAKTIIFDYPKDRYVLDITDLPFYIDIIDEFKCLLNIIDHFSKLCKSYLLKNKKAYNILNYLKDFIKIYGSHKSVGAVNEKEFKNKFFSDYYLSQNNIHYVNGLPYKPHLQGICERVHKTIKTGLYKF